MASLKLNGVNKVYPSGTLALYDINLETSDREFLVVVGAEESGKSTFLYLVYRIIGRTFKALSIW